MADWHESREERKQKWDTRYLQLAKHVSEWSKDPNAKVGAVIVNYTYGRVIALGFNGFPSNVEDSAERLHNKDDKLAITIHAEQNALLFAGRNAKDCDMYVVGKPVCNSCAILIIQAGIRRVIAAEPKRGTDSKWDKAGLIALEVLEEAEVKFEPISSEQLDCLGLNEDAARSGVSPAGLETS